MKLPTIEELNGPDKNKYEWDTLTTNLRDLFNPSPIIERKNMERVKCILSTLNIVDPEEYLLDIRCTHSDWLHFLTNLIMAIEEGASDCSEESDEEG